MTGAAGTNYSGRITDVAGLTVGHYTDAANATGCTVVLSDEPATAGIEVRGAAPGSRETELLHPLAAAQWVNAIVLTGGSVWGLDTPSGVSRYLEERGIGIKFGRARIPLVPAAVVFDLGLITHEVRPTADNGYEAAVSASVDFGTGSVGAGTGCTVAKLRGAVRSLKGGIGTASVTLSGGATVGALIAINAVCDIVDPANGKTIAAPVRDDGQFESSSDILMHDPPRDRGFFRNTVIGVVATDAQIDKIGASRLAIAGQDGIALAVRPAHTSSDGDTIFALSTGRHLQPVSADSLHAGALQAVIGAILDAAHSATALGGIRSVSDLSKAGT